MAEIVGKLHSTASVSANLVRPSPNIDSIRAQLIADARAQWDILKAASEDVLYSDYNALVKDQNTAVAEGTTWEPLLRTLAAIIKTESYATPRRTSSKSAARKAFTAYGKACYTASNNAFSELQRVWYQGVDSQGFQSGLGTIVTKYMDEVKTIWVNTANGLYTRFEKTYDAGYSNSGPTALRTTLPYVYSTFNTNVTRYQPGKFASFFKDLKVLWENTFLKERLADIETAMAALQSEVQTTYAYLKNDGTYVTEGVLYPETTTLRPFDVVTITADDAPLFRGYPTNAPLWARVTPSLSSDGTIISSQRLRPLEIVTGADQRWVADADYWDDLTGTWRAVVNKFNYSILADDVNSAPTLVTTSQTLGNELITRTSFRISGGNKFLCYFNRGLDSLSAFTISMVIAPNAAPGSYPILDYWFNVGAGTPATGDRFAWWLNDRLDFYYGNNGGSVDQIASLSKMRPLVITSTVDNGVCRTYVGYSPRHNFSTMIKTKMSSRSQWLRFQVGGSYQTLTENQYADFNIYEMNLWTKALTNDQVTALHGDFYSTYGTAHDWR